jgi:hypothetical protein
VTIAIAGRCAVIKVLRPAEYAPEPNPQTKNKDVVWFALHKEGAI